MQFFDKSSKLANVCYDIRGPVLDKARQMEEEGQHIIKLNIGNIAAFGLEPPDEIVQDMIRNLPNAAGYTDSKGLFAPRKAIVHYTQQKHVKGVTVDDVFLGNGASELITMSMNALLNDGDEVLIPAPDYPLWTAAVTLSGGIPVHYRCDEGHGWDPDLADIEAKISEHTHAIVIINPNNPTGAVYSETTVKGLVDIARRHDLVVMADEIYEKILYDEAVHHHAATYAGDDVLCLTFSGLSKAYRVCGYRAGWVMISGPLELATDFLEGLTLIANMRMCANVPAQHAIQTALGGYQSIQDLVAPGGRFHEQTMLADRLLNEIPGVTCVKPKGALYVFPRLDPTHYPIEDDEHFVLDLLRAEKMLVVQGTGFNWPLTDHLRIVTLPPVEMLEDAIGRLARFLEGYAR